jgi:hypothetical protein
MGDLSDMVHSAVRDILTPAGKAATPPTAKGDPWEAMRKFRKLTNSKFADSLETLVGKPSATVLANMPAGTLGQYSKPAKYGDPVQQDTVYLAAALFNRDVGKEPAADPAKYRTQPEYALAHEMGHRMDAESLAKGDSALSVMFRTMEDSTVNEAIRTGSTLPDAYWMQSPHEHYAEAFAQAVTVLRRTAKDATAAPDAIAKAETAVPGTKAMLQKLLAQPLYEQHPLRKK